MLHSLTPSSLERVCAAAAGTRAACLRRADVGLGDDLDERRAAAVEVDHGVVGSRRCGRPSPPACTSLAASSSRCTRVMPHAASRRPPSTRPAAAGAERLVVLADLVRLGQVRIEVVLAVEDDARGDRRSRAPGRCAIAVLDGALVDHRQRARVAPGRPGRCACWAGRRTWCGAAAEHLGARVQLDVDLEADDGSQAVGARCIRGARSAGGRRVERRSRPRARARRRSRRFSLKAGPIELEADRQAVARGRRGCEMRGQAGEVDRDRADVAQVHRAAGRRSRSPSRKATVGEVGEAMQVARRRRPRRSRGGSACAPAARGRSRRRSSRPRARRCRS